MSKLNDESANDTKIEEHVDESSISQNDYKKLKLENEEYRQELHVLRLKLESREAFVKDLQDSHETLETSLKRYVQTTIISSEKEEKYKSLQKEYENYIETLETNKVKSELEMTQLHKELKQYKDLADEQSYYLIAKENTLTQYKEELVELSKQLTNKKERLFKKEKNEKELMEKLVHMEAQYEELQCSLKKTKEQLMEKNKELENAQESARDLAMNLKELESSNMTPASNTCKGNSLFAEVEDQRQMLLNKMKVLSNKYSEVKQELNSKMIEIKFLKAEKFAMIKKWETDKIDTLQENTDFIDKCKSTIMDLQYKLKAEMKKNVQVEEKLSTDDSFNYAQLLLVAKGKELKELNKKIEKQVMQMLMQDEVNHSISRQLRYWQSKAMFLEIKIRAIKDQLKLQDTNDSKILLESIENCIFPDNVNFEKADNDSFVPDELVPKVTLKYELTHKEDSKEVSKKPVVEDSANKQKEFRRFVDFTSDTKDSESKSLKKQAKQHDYPVIVYKDDDTFCAL